MDLATVVEELYGMAPVGFTARRDQRAADAKKSGDKDLAASIKALRRPSAAAFALNLMARAHGERIDQLMQLGELMRAAQEALSGDELRALGRRRSQLISGLSGEVRALAREAGHSLSEAAAREVETTLEAALADPEAGEAVRQGRLIRALERSGLDPVDLEGAVAGGPNGSRGPIVPLRPRPAEAGDQDRAEHAARARELADQADARAQEGAARTAAAADEHERAELRRLEADAAVQRLEHELRAARDRADEAAEAEAATRRTLREAEAERDDTAASAARARAAADALEN